MPIKYSPTEERLLKLIPRFGEKITTKALAKRFYRNREMPEHGQIYIANAMRSLGRKLVRNREKFKLMRTPQSGPREIQFWRE